MHIVNLFIYDMQHLPISTAIVYGLMTGFTLCAGTEYFLARARCAKQAKRIKNWRAGQIDRNEHNK